MTSIRAGAGERSSASLEVMMSPPVSKPGSWEGRVPVAMMALSKETVSSPASEAITASRSPVKRSRPKATSTPFPRSSIAMPRLRFETTPFFQVWTFPQSSAIPAPSESPTACFAL